MVEHKVEPVEELVEDAPAPNQTQNHQPPQSRGGQPTASSGPKPRRQCSPASSAQTPESTSCVRNEVLKRVVAQQQQRISQLERQVDKKKETFRRLSNSPPFTQPPGVGILSPVPPTATPPGASVPASPAVQSSQSQPDPTTTAGDTTNVTQQQQHQSQPLAHNPATAGSMAAMNAASTQPMPGPVHLQYPFFRYPHLDNPVIAPPFMSVVSTVPPHPIPPRMQRSSSTSPSRANQASEEGGNRQSRYWTEDEHQRYLAAVETFGRKNYQQIAEVVGTRNAKQVRTHSQKFQKKLEREEARRRGDLRILSEVHTAGQAQIGTPADMSDGTPGQALNRLRRDDVHDGGPATVSSKSLNPNDTPPSAKSVDGSSSTNNTPLEPKGETNIDSDHAKAKAAAAAAVAAEAVALGYGRLPPGPNTTANKVKVGNTPDPGLQIQKRWPAETKNAKPDDSQAPLIHTGANLADPGRAPQSQTKSHATSHPVILPSPRTNTGVPRLEVKSATHMPGGRGAESHHHTEKKSDQKLHGSAEVLAPSRRPTQSSVNVSSAHPRVGPEKRQVAKLMPSAVKIEPRIVPSVPNSGPLQVSCPTTATITHSRLTVLPGTGSLNPEIETCAEKSTRDSAAQADHKPVEGVSNTCVKTDEDSDAPVTLTKEATAPAYRKREAIPNGQHGTRNIHQRDRPEVVAVPNKPSANKSALPAAPKKEAQKASTTPYKKPDESSHARDPFKTSGNGDSPKESQRIAPIDQNRAEQRKEQRHIEKAESGHADCEDAQISDRTNGVGANNAFAIQKGIGRNEPPSASESASVDRVARKDKKSSLQQKDGIDAMDRQIKQKSTSDTPVGPAVSGAVIGSRDSFKTGTVKRFATQPSPAPIKESETAPIHKDKELVMKKRNHGDHVSGGTEQNTECDPQETVKEAQVKRQRCNTDSAVDEAANGQQGFKRSTSSGANASNQYGEFNEAEKDLRGQTTCKTLNGQVDPCVGTLGAALYRSTEGRYKDEKSEARAAKNTIRMEKMDSTNSNGRGTKQHDSEEEAKKGNLKRSLESGVEPVAKRPEGRDDGSKIHREDERNRNEVEVPQS